MANFNLFLILWDDEITELKKNSENLSFDYDNSLLFVNEKEFSNLSLALDKKENDYDCILLYDTKDKWDESYLNDVIDGLKQYLETHNNLDFIYCLTHKRNYIEILNDGLGDYQTKIIKGIKKIISKSNRNIQVAADEYSHIPADLFYPVIKDLLESIVKKEYYHNLERLRSAFWNIEDKDVIKLQGEINKFYSTTPPPSSSASWSYITCISSSPELDFLSSTRKFLKSASDFNFSNCCFIWNDSDAITTDIKSNYHIITNKFDWKKMKQNEKKDIKNIFILVELTWDERMACQLYGFRFVHDELLKGNLEWGGGECPNIYFVSCIVNKHIMAFGNLITQSIAPCFPLLDFGSPPPFKDFPSYRLQYIKDCIIGQKSFLDILEHDLRPLTKSPQDKEHYSKQLFDILIRISRSKSYCDESILKTADKINPTQAFIKKELTKNGDDIVKDVNDLHGTVKIYLDKIVANAGPLETHSKQYKAMIIDDDKKFAQNFQTLLKNFFRNVEQYNIGSVALKELEKNPDDYDIVFVDLQLLDDYGWYQDTWGLDIIDKCRALPHIVVVVITGLRQSTRDNVRKILLNKYDDFQPIFMSKSESVSGGVLLKNQDILADYISSWRYRIGQSTGRRSGPANKTWSNGLLQNYYDWYRNSEKWIEIKNDLESDLDKIFENSGQFKCDLRKLPRGMGTKSFDIGSYKDSALYNVLLLRLWLFSEYYKHCHSEGLDEPMDFQKFTNRANDFGFSSPRDVTKKSGWGAFCQVLGISKKEKSGVYPKAVLNKIDYSPTSTPSSGTNMLLPHEFHYKNKKCVYSVYPQLSICLADMVRAHNKNCFGFKKLLENNFTKKQVKKTLADLQSHFLEKRFSTSAKDEIQSSIQKYFDYNLPESHLLGSKINKQLKNLINP